MKTEKKSTSLKRFAGYSSVSGFAVTTAVGPFSALVVYGGSREQRVTFTVLPEKGWYGFYPGSRLTAEMIKAPSAPYEHGLPLYVRKRGEPEI